MLTTWDAVSTLDRMFDDMMRPARGAATHARSTNFTPDHDVRATEEELVLAFDLPGVKREDLDVTLHQHVLTVKGVRKLDKGERTFSQSFTLPTQLDESKLGAELTDGVLTVRIPKQPKAQPVKIEIATQPK